jgi:hypothetical protein
MANMSSMWNKVKSLGDRVMILAILVLATAGVSQAGDYCITFDGISGVAVVGRGFTIPAKGKCKVWTGFTGGSLVTQNIPSGGAGCTSSDKSHLSLTYTISNPEAGGFVVIDSVTLSLPAQTGTDVETTITGGSTPTSNSFAVTGSNCTSQHIPVPAVATESPATGSVPRGVAGLP